jgi:hypothetical protein
MLAGATHKSKLAELFHLSLAVFFSFVFVHFWELRVLVEVPSSLLFSLSAPADIYFKDSFSLPWLQKE